MNNQNQQPLYNRPGTIAYALKQNMNELYTINNVSELKRKLLEIVDN